jgi:DNA-binding transcriptional LysR family regulator
MVLNVALLEPRQVRSWPFIAVAEGDFGSSRLTMWLGQTQSRRPRPAPAPSEFVWKVGAAGVQRCAGRVQPDKVKPCAVALWMRHGHMTHAGRVLNLRHIEVFHSVYVNGSVSRASRALNVSQPAVSKVLKHAQDRLGFQLFRLVNGRLIPTDEAHILFREVAEVYDRIGSLKITATNLGRSQEGHIRLAVLPSLGLGIGPSAVARCRAEMPGVTFDIKAVHHDDIVRSLYERDTDLTLGYRPPQDPKLGDIEVGAGELVVLFRTEDLPDAPARVDLGLLQDRDFIVLNGPGPLTHLITHEVDSRYLDIKGSISVRTYYLAAALVRYGAGLAVIDEFTARAGQAPGLDYRPLDPPVHFSVHCMFLSERPPSIPQVRFIKILQETLAAVRD